MLKKINAIDTSGLVEKTKYDNKIKDIEDKIPAITNSTTTATLFTVEQKISILDDLVILFYFIIFYRKE